jgi:hypothetical protein
VIDTLVGLEFGGLRSVAAAYLAARLGAPWSSLQILRGLSGT